MPWGSTFARQQGRPPPQTMDGWLLDRLFGR
jgi:hypothetical protein